MIARAVAVLQTLEGKPAGLNMSQIARDAGLPRSTTQRLVGAWVAQRFLVVDGNGRIHLGPALARLAVAARAETLATLHPHLEALRDQVQETVHLWAGFGPEVVLVDQVVCNQEVRVVTPIGVGLPCAYSAGGKALLAGLSDTEVRRLTEGRMVAFTPHSLTRLDALLEELAQVRAAGIAFDYEQHSEDVAAVGVALPNAGGDPLALCIPAPLRRFLEKRERLVEAILKCRDRIAQEA
ncbi:MAG: IclR family transcriptional regulator [Holophaga sp.]|nr:IclR family transcriptional regulator [Holophaga sp.]